MASLAGLYSPEDKPQTRAEAIPTGEYKAVIVDSEMKKTNSGDGEYLEIQHQIVCGDCAGRRVYSRLNLINRNQKAMDIARSDLAQIRIATGKFNAQDSVELHNIPVLIRVEHLPADPAKNRTTAQNEIKGWKPISDVSANATQQQAPYMPPAAQFPPQHAQAAAQAAPAARPPLQQ